MGERKRERDREGGRREKRDRAKERGGSSDGLAGREHEDPKRGQRENDKGERGGGFDWKGRQRGLFPAFSPYYVPCVLSVVPARACSPTRTHSHIHTYVHTYTCMHHIVHPRSLFFLSFPSSPSTSCPILLLLPLLLVSSIAFVHLDI